MVNSDLGDIIELIFVYCVSFTLCNLYTSLYGQHIFSYTVISKICTYNVGNSYLCFVTATHSNKYSLATPSIYIGYLEVPLVTQVVSRDVFSYTYCIILQQNCVC